MRATQTARRLVPLIAVGLTLATTAPADAATLRWSPCSDGFECSMLPVALDRSAPARGTVSLALQRARAAQNPENVAVVALAGGPGQSALALSSTFVRMLGSGLGSRDLLLFDQRGTGTSGPLSCSSLASARTLLSAELGCATELGEARGYYRTADTVKDLEELRVAAGYDRLVLFGVSYGTKVAQEYAAAHPARVESLILDSLVSTTGPDPFRRSSLRAIGRTLRSLCSANACRRATPSPTADLSAVARKLDGRTASAKVITSSGRAVRRKLSQTGLLGTLFSGDLDPTTRAELPGSLRAARRGDWAPLMRLAARSSSSSRSALSGSGSAGTALFLSTTCEETDFAWNRRAGPMQRWTEISAAAAAVPRSQRAPFSARTMLDAGSAPLCVGWPAVGPLPTPATPLAPVPTLILSGEMDLRTPIEDALKVERAVPQSQLLRVPHTGHSVLTNDASDCSADAVAAFFAGRAITACSGANRYKPMPRPARSLREVTPASGLSGRRGLAVRLVRDTVNDALRQVIGAALSSGDMPARVGGLRAGTASASVSDDALTLVLNRYQYVPGIDVSGQYSTAAGGTLTVRGGGIRASLQLSTSGAVRGTVNGTSVSATAAAATFSAGSSEPSVHELLSQAQSIAALGQ